MVFWQHFRGDLAWIDSWSLTRLSAAVNEDESPFDQAPQPCGAVRWLLFGMAVADASVMPTEHPSFPSI